jgi:MFS family permease
LSRRAAIYGLSLLTLLNFVNYIDRYILAAVQPRILDEFKLTNTEGGLIFSAFLVVYFLSSPIFGRLGDRLSRTRLMAIGVGAWSLATAASGIVRSFGQLLAARAAVGVGEAAYGTISPALISDYFSPERRGRAFAVFYVAIPVGSAVGYILGGELEHAFHSWRSVFFIVGIPGLVLALLALTAPDPPRGIQDRADAHLAAEQAASLRDVLKSLLRNRTYTWTVLGYAAYTFAIGGLSFWAPRYFEHVRGLPLNEADRLIGTAAVVSGLFGTFAGGYLGDWLQARFRGGYLWLSGTAMLVAVPFAWLALAQASDRFTYTWALFVAEFFVFLSTGPINVVIVSVVPVAMRATAMAVSIFAIHLFGDAISPTILGIAADTAGWPTAALIVPVVIGVSGIIWTATAVRGVRIGDGIGDRGRGSGIGEKHADP